MATESSARDPQGRGNDIPYDDREKNYQTYGIGLFDDYLRGNSATVNLWNK